MVAKKWIITGVTGGTLLIVAIIIIACSIKTVKENTVGLKFNKWTQNLNEGRVYVPGYYFLGPTSYFKVFPTTFVSLTFSDDRAIRARTKDGIIVTVSCQLSFAYNTLYVAGLYKLYTDSTVEFIDEISQNEVRDALNQYTAYQIQTELVRVQLDLFDHMTATLAEPPFYVTLKTFELSTPKLPDQYLVMLNKVSSITANIETARNQQSTEIARKENEANIAITKAEANRVRTVTSNERVVETREMYFVQECTIETGRAAGARAVRTARGLQKPGVPPESAWWEQYWDYGKDQDSELSVKKMVDTLEAAQHTAERAMVAGERHWALMIDKVHHGSDDSLVQTLNGMEKREEKEKDPLPSIDAIPIDEKLYIDMSYAAQLQKPTLKTIVTSDKTTGSRVIKV